MGFRCCLAAFEQSKAGCMAAPRACRRGMSCEEPVMSLDVGQLSQRPSSKGSRGHGHGPNALACAKALRLRSPASRGAAGLGGHRGGELGA